MQTKNWQRRKDDLNEKNWSKMETVNGAIWRRGADLIREMHNARILVGHCDRTRAISHIVKSGIVRGKSRTRQTLCDAWESTVGRGVCGDPLASSVTETKLMKKFSIDEEGTDLLLPRMLVMKLLEVERGRLYVLFTDIEAHGYIGSGPGCTLLTSHGEDTKPRKD